MQQALLLEFNTSANLGIEKRMMKMTRTLSMTAAIALSVGLLSGCASTAQLEELKAEVAKATEKAEKAMDVADKAADSAEAAQTSAEDAKARADAAVDAANAARRASDDQQKMYDRMMQKAMSK
jgi:murein lipoprotein